MKNILKSFMIVCAAAFVLAACNEGPIPPYKVEKVDPYSINFVYLRTPVANSHKATFSTSGNWKSKPDSISSYIQILCTKPAPQDIKVNLEIDESMVETYNTANGTDYQLLSQVKLLQNELVIKKGDYLTTDTLKTVITDYAPIVEAGSQNYIVPIKITNTTSGVVSEQNHFYVFYQASMLFAEITNGGYYGNKIDRSGWKIYLDEVGGEDVTDDLTDDDRYSDVYYLSSGAELYIDLGDVYENIVDIGVQFYSASYTAGSMKVEVSEDNVTYKDLGTYNCKQIAHAVLNLFDPQNARYIKATFYDPISSYYGTDISEIFVAVAAE